MVRIKQFVLIFISGLIIISTLGIQLWMPEFVKASSEKLAVAKTYTPYTIGPAEKTYTPPGIGPVKEGPGVSGDCPASFLEAAATTLNAQVGEANVKVNLRWGVPSDETLKTCSEKISGFDKSNLKWKLNLYQQLPVAQHTQWQYDYSQHSIDFHHPEVQWNGEYQAILDLRSDSDTIGRMTLEFTIPGGPGAAAGVASGQKCDIQNLTAAVETFYKNREDPNARVIHFSWQYKRGSQCKRDYVKIIRPDGSTTNVGAGSGPKQTWVDSDKPQLGKYTFQTLDNDNKVVGSVTVDVTTWFPPNSVTRNDGSGSGSAVIAEPGAASVSGSDEEKCDMGGWLHLPTTLIENAITYMYCVVLQGVIDLAVRMGNMLSDVAGISYDDQNPPDRQLALWRIDIAQAEELSPTTFPLPSASPSPPGTSTSPSPSAAPASTLGWIPSPGISPPEDSLSARLNPDPNVGNASTKAWPVINAWKGIRTFIDVFIIFALIFLAFAQIFRINIETYAIKKTLPGLIMGVIAANFSLFFCRALIDVSNVLAIWLADGSPGELIKQVLGAIGITNNPGTTTKAIMYVVAGGTGIGALTFGLFLYALIILAAVAFGVMLLAILFYVRLGFIYILVAISPLAFMSLGLPMTKGMFQKWWGQFVKWVFMVPVIFFILRFATLFKGDGGGILRLLIVVGLIWAAFIIAIKLGPIGAGVFGFALGRASGMGRWAGGKVKAGAIGTAKAGGGYALDRIDRHLGVRSPRQWIGALKEEYAAGKTREQGRQAMTRAQQRDAVNRARGINSNYADAESENQRRKMIKQHQDAGMDNYDKLYARARSFSGRPRNYDSQVELDAILRQVAKEGRTSFFMEQMAQDRDMQRAYGFDTEAQFDTAVAANPDGYDSNDAMKNLVNQLYGTNEAEVYANPDSEAARGATAMFESIAGGELEKGNRTFHLGVKTDADGKRRYTPRDRQLEIATGIANNLTGRKRAQETRAGTWISNTATVDAQGNVVRNPDNSLVKGERASEYAKATIRQHADSFFTDLKDHSTSMNPGQLEAMGKVWNSRSGDAEVGAAFATITKLNNRTTTLEQDIMAITEDKIKDRLRSAGWEGI